MYVISITVGICLVWSNLETAHGIDRMMDDISTNVLEDIERSRSKRTVFVRDRNTGMLKIFFFLQNV